MEELENNGGMPQPWTLRDRRQMATVIIGRAWERLQADPNLIQRAFLNCGISIHPDGSEDYLINVPHPHTGHPHIRDTPTFGTRNFYALIFLFINFNQLLYQLGCYDDATFAITRVFRLAGFICAILKLARLNLSPPDRLYVSKLRIWAQFDLFALPGPISINLCL
jgi:hypothetical protein